VRDRDNEREELGRQIKDKRRELASIRRKEREKLQERELLLSVINDIDRMEQMTWGEMMLFGTKLERVREILNNDPGASESEKHQVDTALNIIDALKQVRNEAEIKLREIFRKAKIEAHRSRAEAASLMEAATCVVCRKRPRHFGDYCKRCVPPDQRPTGKVM
jgi:hypothetical protein